MRLTSLSRLALTLLLAPACHLALGADNAPSVESFFKDPVTRSATLSPQGHYVALVTRMADGKQILAVRDTSNLKSATVAVTAPDDNKIIALHWINEQRIGFTLKNYRIEFESNLDEFAVDRDGSNLVHREFIEVALEFDAVVFQREADALLVNPVQRDDLVVVRRGDGHRGRFQIAGVAHGQDLLAVGHARHQRHVVPLRRQRGRPRHRVLEKILGAGRLRGGRRQMAGRQQQDEYQAGQAGRSHGRSVAELINYPF